MHLGGRAFEQAPATEHKYCISDKGGFGVGDVIDNVANRMAGRVGDVDIMVSEFKNLFVTNAYVHAGDAGRVIFRADDFCPVSFLEGEITADMIEMVMSVPDLRQAPTGLRDGRFNRRGFGRVDGGGFAADRVVYQKAVIIIQAGK